MYLSICPVQLALIEAFYILPDIYKLITLYTHNIFL